MCILEELHDYVPTISTTATVDVSDTEQTKLTYDDFHYVLMHWWRSAHSCPVASDPRIGLKGYYQFVKIGMPKCVY